MSSDPALLDLLSEMIAVERDGMRLYVGFLDDAPEQERARLRDYAEQSRRAVLILEEAARRLGGDPEYVSPGADVAHRLTEAVLAATEPSQTHRWMDRLLHVIAYELRDRMIWEVLDGLGKREGGETGEVLGTAATAVLSDEAWGAHMQDRNEERVEWALEAMGHALGDELGVEVEGQRRRFLRRPR